jgi:hypothetical protein
VLTSRREVGDQAESTSSALQADAGALYEWYGKRRCFSPVGVSVHEFATGSTTLSSDRIRAALHASAAKGARHATHLTERLNSFIAERGRLAGHVGGGEEIAAFVETLARIEGPEYACEVLDLAARFGDYAIVDYEVYKELASSAS